MPLIGKFVRREGTTVIFGSRNKPEWKPIELSGQFDANVLAPGDYYELDLNDNRLFNARKLPRRSGGGGGGPAAPHSSGGSHASPARSRDALMASATGFAKSCLEGGACKTPKEAAEAGLSWARLWDKENTPVWGAPEPPSPPIPTGRDDVPNDDIPF